MYKLKHTLIVVIAFTLLMGIYISRTEDFKAALLKAPMEGILFGLI